jgi:PAS domain S-box-containing protein
MTREDNPIERAGRLRRQAEKKAMSLEEQELKALSPEETRQMLHELQVHQIELEMQNEELRRTQAELGAARARYFDLYDLAPVGYCTLSEQGLILEANLTAAMLLGLTRGTLVKQPISRFILKEDEDIYYLHRKTLLETGQPQACEVRMVRNDGNAFWTRLEAIAAQNEGSATVCRVALSDITGSKQAEKALQKSLQENRDLLSELQHRAKNSFTMMSSLISLASNANVSPDAKAAFEELALQAKSVSALYSMLYSSGSFNEVQLDDYCARVAVALGQLSGNLALKTEFESVTVPVKKATPIGLIVTELITNAIKYAFPDGRLGTITVALRKTAAGALLEVRDDGVGLPAGFDLAANTGRGLSLVQGLSGQIDGSFRIEGGAGGTRCVVDFVLGGNGARNTPTPSPPSRIAS